MHRATYAECAPPHHGEAQAVARRKSTVDEETASKDADEVHRRKRQGSAKWRTLFSFTTRKHRLLLVLALAFSVASGFVVPIQAVLLGKIFLSFTSFGADTVSQSDFRAEVGRYCIYLCGLGSASWVVDGLYFMFWLAFGEMQSQSARIRIFQDLLGREMEWYTMRRNGFRALLPRIQMQIRDLQLATSQPLGYSVQCFATAVASLGLALYFSWDLTLVILATVPVVAAVLALFSARIQPNIQAQHESLSDAAKYVTNAFTAIETVKCFNGQGAEVQKYSRAIREAAKYYFQQATSNAMQLAFLRFSTLAMFVQGFWYGSSLINAGKKDTGQVLTTFWAALMATQGFQQLLPHLIVLERGRTAGAKLNTLLLQKQKTEGIRDLRDETECDHCVGDVEFREVSFAYPTRNELALSGVSFFFAAGELTFVVGKSGSGKSTLGQLLMRFYSVREGDIYIDGKAMEILDLSWVRRNVTLVEQQSVLFNETLFQNIALGANADAGPVASEDVKKAAEFALLQQTINQLPQGLDTVIGSGGSSLSGGQTQRVALARAKLRDTPILILDECTSALDNISSSLMIDAIRFWRRGKTTVVITHDTTQIRPDDYVYVLSRGHVDQEGYWKSLISDSTSMDGELTVHSDFDQLNPPKLNVAGGHIKHDITTIPAPEDALFAELTEQTRIRRSFIPSVFTDRHVRPQSLERSPLRAAPAMPPIVSSFWRVMPPVNRPVTRKPSDSSESSHTNAILNPLSRKRESMLSFLTPEGLVERTGKIAVGSRMKSLRNRPPATSKTFEKLQATDAISIPMFSNFRLGLKRERQSSGIESTTQILRTVWPSLTWHSRTLLIIGFFGAFIHAICTPVFSWVFSNLMETFYLGENRAQRATTYSVAIIGIAAGDAVAAFLMVLLLERCGQIWVNKIRMEAICRILLQPRRFFDDKQHSASRLAESLDRNAEEMRNLLGRFAGFLFVAAVLMLTSLTWSLQVCWKLTLVGLGTTPVLYGITYCYQAVSGVLEGNCNTAAESAASIFAETLSSISTVRALTLESYFSKKYQQATARALRIGFRRAAYSGLFYGISESAIIFVTALLFYYGSVIVASAQFSVPEVLEVFSLLLFTMSNVNAIIAFVPQISSSRDTARRLLRLSRLPKMSHEDFGTIRLSSVGDISAENLTFSYPSRPDQTILHNINFSIRAGTVVAIVGSSGSGKSTIASLLLKLYAANGVVEGPFPRIFLSGEEITQIHTPSLRSLIAVVSQTPTLLAASIADNITYGLSLTSPFATDASIRSAAVAAGIDDFIMSLPSGYRTVIGEGGIGLSGGQAQRIAIARALVRKPSVLILDEATSALDVDSAGIVRGTIRDIVRNQRTATSLGGYMKGAMTVIIITHSRSMMEIADDIIMLDQGSVVEQGSFNDLLACNGPFTNLLNGGEWNSEA